MTLVQLRHFLALATHGSFSGAAPRLFLTQPALSRSIRALEDELGQPLFDRVGRRVELTPFGQGLLGRARDLVTDAEDLQGQARQRSQGVGGSLRVGLGSGPGALLMTPLLLGLAQHQPQLRVEVRRSHTELLVQALRERALDALVVDLRSLRPAPDLKTGPAHELRGAFMVRRGHPLARRRRPLAFAKLQAYPVASTPLSDEVARVLVERFGPDAHPDRCITLRCEEVASLVDLTRACDAVLLAVRAAAPDLVELRTDPPLNATARFALVTLARRTEVPALDLLRSLMNEQLREVPRRQPGERCKMLSVRPA
jgi:DNA-binding transcriptional LysR family regulator